MNKEKELEAAKRIGMLAPKDNDEMAKPFACEVEVTFPTNLQAEQALKVLQVDKEPTDRVTKSFRLSTSTPTAGEDEQEEEVVVTMVVRFESKELKMLRVAVSSFYDYLMVVIRTMQEFDTTMAR